MPSTLDWAIFFGGAYKLYKEKEDEHFVILKFEVRTTDCLTVTLSPDARDPGRGKGNGFYHLLTGQCMTHWGNYRKPCTVLDQNVMECDYEVEHPTGKEEGHLRCAIQTPHSFPRSNLPSDWPIVTWAGSIWQTVPKSQKWGLRLIKEKSSNPPDSKYPWVR